MNTVCAAGDGVSAGSCFACASRTWCLLEPILPESRLRFQPKEELSEVVEAPKVLKRGFGGKKAISKQCSGVGKLLCFPLAVVLDVCGWIRACLCLLLHLPAKLEPCV